LNGRPSLTTERASLPPIDKSSDIFWYDLGASMCKEFAEAGITDLLNMPE
jgi:hypothetical protein